MRVGIIQSSYIPWRGYFDFIASVDLFIFLDDVQYTARDWRNRNRIKTATGSRWITVPVRHRTRSQSICETEIDASRDWPAQHARAWESSYGRAPYFADVEEILAIQRSPSMGTISGLNIELTRRICGYLSIATPTVVSTELGARGASTERLVDLVRKVGGRTYLSGPSAANYLDRSAFAAAGIALEYKTYDYAPYPQAWGDFDGAVTVLDLIANCGPDATRHLRSRRPDVKVV